MKSQRIFTKTSKSNQQVETPAKVKQYPHTPKSTLSFFMHICLDVFVCLCLQSYKSPLAKTVLFMAERQLGTNEPTANLQQKKTVIASFVHAFFPKPVCELCNKH